MICTQAANPRPPPAGSLLTATLQGRVAGWFWLQAHQAGRHRKVANWGQTAVVLQGVVRWEARPQTDRSHQAVTQLSITHQYKNTRRRCCSALSTGEQHFTAQLIGTTVPLPCSRTWHQRARQLHEHHPINPVLLLTARPLPPSAADATATATHSKAYDQQCRAHLLASYLKLESAKCSHACGSCLTMHLIRCA